MKYCSNCGKQIDDNAYICVNCGVIVENRDKANSTDMDGIIRAFLIVSTVLMGLAGFLIPLIWCVPLTVKCCNKMSSGEEISDGLKICVLLLVSQIAGILLFLRDNRN